MNQDNTIKIALTFSGGGYRAAAFHLGVLSYLHSVKLDNGTLLDHIHAMSTISGGTITGLRYMLGYCKGEDPVDIFKSLYRFFVDVDLTSIAMGKLSKKKHEQTVSLIRTMSDIYNEKLFEGGCLGELMNNIDKNHIKHFSANATDFVNALPFRFQATVGKQNSNTGYGIIGNSMLRLPRAIASHIRLSEILACSSCFPSGFEPMVFPVDFDLGESKEVKDYIEKIEPFGIMDGGIVDNQGIEPIILADDRMVKNSPGDKDAGFDLVIISDVSSPYMRPYTPSSFTLPKKLSKLSLYKISILVRVTWLIITLLTILSFYLWSFSFISGILSAVWIIVVLLLSYYYILENKIIEIAKESIVKNNIRDIVRLKAENVATLLANRVSSVLMLVSTVFMKHIRRMNYRSAYEKDSWKNRIIMNGIYELRPGESWASKFIKKGIPEYLIPSQLIQDTSEKATAMGTTLWFTENDKKNGIHDALIATGQYTICFNLLEYISSIKNNTPNTNKSHKYLLSLKERLMTDWEEFQKNPMCKMDGFREESDLS